MRKPFCCRYLATSRLRRPERHSTATSLLLVELADAVGHFAHRNVHDLLIGRHAGDAELPGFAHIEQRQHIAALAAGDEFGRGDLGNLLREWP